MTIYGALQSCEQDVLSRTDMTAIWRYVRSTIVEQITMKEKTQQKDNGREWTGINREFTRSRDHPQQSHELRLEVHSP